MEDLIIADGYAHTWWQPTTIREHKLPITAPFDKYSFHNVVCQEPLWRLSWLLSYHYVYRDKHTGRLVKNYFELRHGYESKDLEVATKVRKRKVPVNKDDPECKETVWEEYDEPMRNMVANSMYRVFRIPKPNARPGQEPWRYIQHPYPFLKKVQRCIGEWIDQLPLHDCFHGFVKGRGIGTCLKDMLGCHGLWHGDIVKAFPNTTQKMLYRLFNKKWGLSDEVSKIISELATYHNRMATGSPLSPRLLNHYLQEYVVLPTIAEIENKYGGMLRIYADGFHVAFMEDASQRAMEAVARLITKACRKAGYDLHKISYYRPGSTKVKQPFGLGLIDPEDLFTKAIEKDEKELEPSINRSIIQFGMYDLLHEVYQNGIQETAKAQGLSADDFIKRITGRFSAWNSCGLKSNHKCLESYREWMALVKLYKSTKDLTMKELVEQQANETQIYTSEDAIPEAGDQEKDDFKEYFGQLVDILNE